MSRGISATTKAELAKDGFRLATLIEFGFDTIIRLTDYGQTVTAGAVQYSPSSHLIEIGSVAESSALQINSIDLVLSSVEQSFLNLFMYGDYLDVSVRIDRATVDSNGLVIGTKFNYFEGRIVSYKISEDKDRSEMTVELASHWKDFEKINCRRTNPNSQARYFPDDRGFDFAAKSVKDIKWGRK